MKLFALNDLDRGPGRALLEATVQMGFSEAVSRAGLEAELRAWFKPGARSSLEAELPQGLDPARRPNKVLIIAARTLPASTMRATLRARLLEADVLIKPAQGQVALAEAIAASDPHVSVRAFGSEDVSALDAAISEVDAVVVLGSDESVEAVRARTPHSTAFVAYGHRVSAAWLGAEDDASLLALARDLCAWDQAGCLSPQVVWVNSPPATLLPRLSEALRKVEADLPMRVPKAALVARQSARTYAEMVGHVSQTESALLCALDVPDFRPSPGYRFLWVLPASEPHLRAVEGHLSTLGISGPLALPLAPHVRRAPLGEMQRPPLTWTQDGLPNLTPMLRP
mgnify:CR=1 FL=1